MDKKPTVKKSISIALIVAGVILTATALVLETSSFPWRTLVHMERAEEDIPAPAPIVLSAEDAEINIVVGSAPSPEEAYDLLPGSEEDDTPPDAFVILGAMKIPKLEVSQHILEGTGRQLRYGTGHVAGTAGIGEKGNLALAAHRTQAFRHLDLLSEGDEVVLKANDNIFTYIVYESFDVKPTELWVLDPVEGEEYIMTMITCTPYTISSHRLIVRARLTEINGLSPEEFFASVK